MLVEVGDGKRERVVDPDEDRRALEEPGAEPVGESASRPVASTVTVASSRSDPPARSRFVDADPG